MQNPSGPTKGPGKTRVGLALLQNAYRGELVLGRGLQYRVLDKTESKLVLEVVS